MKTNKKRCLLSELLRRFSIAGKLFITGHKKLDKALLNLGKEAPKIVRKVLREEQKEISKEVKNTMPVGETKQAKKNVKVKSAKRSRVRIGLNTVIAPFADPSKWYSTFFEYGTSKQPAQGTIRKVWDKKKDKAKKNLISKIWSAIHRKAKQ